MTWTEVGNLRRREFIVQANSYACFVRGGGMWGEVPLVGGEI
jgi:hypothetical protein